MPCLVLCLLLASCGPVAAAEKTPVQPESLYSAKITYLYVRGQDETSLCSTITGKKGTPLKSELGRLDVRNDSGRAESPRFKIEISEVAKSKPTQYLVKARLVLKRQDGSEVVLSEPTLVTTEGRAARLLVGSESGDRTEMEITVTEKKAAEPGPNK